MTHDINDPQLWMLLPPGNIAIARRPLDKVPDDMRMATSPELLAANLGRPFPWGQMPTPASASKLWQEHRIGFGGLYHDQWFITKDGRFGGAENVPKTLPGTLRCGFHYSGGFSDEKADNEGYAIIRTVAEINQNIYRRVQMHANKHVAADGGHIIVGPIDPQTNIVRVGFVGRCQTCPNAELISFEQLKSAVPEYKFELFDEWKGWSLEKRPELQQLAMK